MAWDAGLPSTDTPNVKNAPKRQARFAVRAARMNSAMEKIVAALPRAIITLLPWMSER
jgi:hypothetical protein